MFPTFTPKQEAAFAATKKFRYTLFGGAGGGGKFGRASAFPIVNGKEDSFTADKWDDNIFRMDTKVLTWNGLWKPLSLIQVGDRIMNPDGNHQDVIAVHDQGQKQLYRVTFEDGTSTECGADHLWGFWFAGERSRRKSSHGKNPVFDDREPRGWNSNYIRRARVRDTAWLKNFVDRGRKVLVPVNAPMHYTGLSRATPSSCYALGLMIGNGSLTHGAAFGTSDREVIDWLVAWDGCGRTIKTVLPEERKNPKFNYKCAWHIVHFRNKSKVLVLMRNSDLLGKKSHERKIPIGFLHAPLAHRYALAQGLFDTDGCATLGKRSVSFATSSENLKNQVCELVRSLGYMAKVSYKSEPKFQHKGEIRTERPAWVVHVQGNNLEMLFRVKRKKDRAQAMGEFNGGASWPGKRIVSIEPTVVDYCRCITVTHPNGLYVTDDFIVTHNSHWLRWYCVAFLLSAWRKLHLKNVEVGLFCETFPALEGRQIKKIKTEMSGWLGDWNEGKHEFRLREEHGSGILRCLNLDDPEKYRSSEFAAIAVDELTMNTRDVFDALLWRIRWPGIKDPRFVAATNPTGPGHLWCKKLWIDRNFKNEPPALKPEDFAYIPAKATDNLHLPPTYFTETLASLPDFMRKALMDGSWDVIEGQYFTSWNEEIHVVKPWPYEEGLTDKWGIPIEWQRVGGIDWGRAKPWAALEAAIDPDGRLIVYRGVAEAGWEHERQADWIRVGSPKATFYADDACFSKGAGNSLQSRAIDMSHAELWAKFGATNIMRAKKGDRVAGWQHLDSFLRPMPRIRRPEYKDKGESFSGQAEVEGWYYPRRAWIEFFDTAGLRGEHGVITTLPKVIHDPNRNEDVESSGDDHAADALRYMSLSRPSPKIETKPDNPYSEGDYFSRRGRERYEAEGETVLDVAVGNQPTIGGY